MLFSGLLLQPSDVLIFLRWLAYISPLRYTLTLMAYYAFIDTTYGSDEDIQLVNTSVNPRGFICPQLSAMSCYGVTGHQILTTLSYNYETIDPDLNQGALILILVGTCALFKVAYVGAFLGSCNTSAAPNAAPPCCAAASCA